MSGINLVVLLGRLGKDPELKNAGGMAICNFSIATSKSWKDESGEKHERTQWHDIVCFRKTAEVAGRHLAKGRQVHITGELQTRDWIDETSGQKRYRTEVIANHIEFISDGKSQSPGATVDNAKTMDTTSAPDDIPF